MSLPISSCKHIVNLYNGHFGGCSVRKYHLLLYISILVTCYFWRNSPPLDFGLLIHEVSRSHTTTHHGRWDSSGRVISSSRDLYQTTHNTHNRQTSMPPLGLEPTISARERPQTYALDRAAIGTDSYVFSRE